MRAHFSAVICLLLFAVAGCDPPLQTCVPGLQYACDCPSGNVRGEQLCRDDGISLADCTGCVPPPDLGLGDLGAADALAPDLRSTPDLTPPGD